MSVPPPLYGVFEDQPDILVIGAHIYHNARSTDNLVAYSPSEVISHLLYLWVALICGLVVFRTRRRIKRVLWRQRSPPREGLLAKPYSR